MAGVGSDKRLPGGAGSGRGSRLMNIRPLTSSLLSPSSTIPAHLHHPIPRSSSLLPRHSNVELNNFDIDIVSGLREGF